MNAKAVNDLDKEYMELVAEFVTNSGRKVLQVTHDSVVYKEDDELVEVHSIAEAIEKLNQKEE